MNTAKSIFSFLSTMTLLSGSALGSDIHGYPENIRGLYVGATLYLYYQYAPPFPRC